MATDDKADLGKTADGREFPTHGGELLSWDIGSSFTPRDQSEGYPRTRAIIRAFAKHRPEQLARERSSLINGSFDRMFGHNATKLLSLVDEEQHRWDTPASRTRSLSSIVTSHSLVPHSPGPRCAELGCGPGRESELSRLERGPRAVGVDGGPGWEGSPPPPRRPNPVPPGKARCSVCGKVGSKVNLAKHEAGCKTGDCGHGESESGESGDWSPMGRDSFAYLRLDGTRLHVRHNAHVGTWSWSAGSSDGTVLGRGETRSKKTAQKAASNAANEGTR